MPKVLQHLKKANGVFLVVGPMWKKTFSRGDLKIKAKAAPFQLLNLDDSLAEVAMRRLSLFLTPQGAWQPVSYNRISRTFIWRSGKYVVKCPNFRFG